MRYLAATMVMAVASATPTVAQRLSVNRPNRSRYRPRYSRSPRSRVWSAVVAMHRVLETSWPPRSPVAVPLPLP
uniref:Putative secreted protein n=1 Tax=Anopheles darlingi TaxID=43151 RepID=A0A2M4D8F3_ANODA